MTHSHFLPFALAVALTSSACSSPSETPDLPAQEPAPRETEAIEPNARLSSTDPLDEESAVERALATALEHGWKKLRVFSGCREGGEMITAEVHGSGVGIWNGRGQYNLDETAVRRHLELLATSGFAGFEAIYGGKPDVPRINRTPIDLPAPGQPTSPSSPPGMKSMNAAIVVKCQVQLDLTPSTGEPISKQVVQRVRGDAFEPLIELSEQLLRMSRSAARSAVLASDVGDGLAKLAEGRLASEALRLQIQRRPPRGSGETGWLLELQGEQASFRVLRDQGGYTEPRTLDFARDEAASLAADLSELRIADLDSNLETIDGYTDLRITILDRELQIQARGSGDTPIADLDSQARSFDQIYQRLANLYRELSERSEQGS